MVILLGATGYVGQAYAHYLQKLGVEGKCPTRSETDYTCPILFEFFRANSARFLH